MAELLLVSLSQTCSAFVLLLLGLHLPAKNLYYHLVLMFRLETTLRNFSCLTVGDNIMVAYNNKKYYIDIIESKPANAISIIETDCEVDFAPPLDYKEPERVTPPPVPTAPQVSSQGL